LFVILFAAGILSQGAAWLSASPDLHALLRSIYEINLMLLIFNILPIYPLDGGQILRSLLWFVLGRVRSLMAATVIGLLGAAGFILLAVRSQSIWLGAISVFVLMTSWSGLQQARALSRFTKLPRRQEFACPACKASPPVGEFWKCGRCTQAFDTFQTGAVCSHCGAQFDSTRCLDCGSSNSIRNWSAPVLVTEG